MFIYRLEHKTTGIGPYNCGGELALSLDKVHNDSNHPNVFVDGLFISVD